MSLDHDHHHDHDHGHDHHEGGHGHDQPPPTARRARGLRLLGETPVQWRSLEERDGAPEQAAAASREFPEGAEILEGVSRRDFVQLLGASLALTGAACQRPNQKIVPFVRRPPEVTPGNALHFATAYALEGYARGLVVDSYTGRPTKIEGNPDHPDSLGATSALDQAVLLGLYDADRARTLTWDGKPVAWRGLLAALARQVEAAAKNGGAGIRFLVEPSSSPLLADLRARILQKLPNARFVSFSPVAGDGAAEGAQLAFGRPLEARHDLSQAQVVLALDSDFLADGPEQVRLHRQFSANRLPGPTMNRLYVAEPGMTSTGSMADHRLRVRGGDVIAVVQALVAELARLGVETLGPLAGLARASQAPVDARWVAAVAKDLARVRGKGLVLAGRRQPAAVHALVDAINFALGNVGTTVNFAAPVRHDALSGVEPLRTLVEDVAAGRVETLVITAQNPAYTGPGDFKLDKLLERVPTRVYLSLYEDETAALATSFVPAAHVLESWGDARAVDGTVSLVQPLIAPLWGGITEAELLAAFVGEGDKGAHELLRQLWRKRATDENRATAATFDGLWESWLAKGVIENTAIAPEQGLTLDPGRLAGGLALALAQAAPKGGGDGLEVSFTPCPKVWDGRFANNSWLQELPHPITKITWDNAVLVSQTTATRLGLKTSDVVRVEVALGRGPDGKEILRQATGPVYVQPGHADDSITVALGYGRKAGGAVARGVGFDAYALRGSTGSWFVRGAQLTKTARNYRFGITQDHWAMEEREPAMATTVAALADQHSKFNERVSQRRAPLITIHEPVDYSQQPYKWAMAIDLSKCSGCNACVTACQSENNIPVVGRENVRIGREMHWIRLDRYYSGPVEDPETVMQPQMCVHCETAPCEYVCPVNATVHSDEGLNEMVYNRCIGTRYCSNNCPYKARRFNFLDYYGEVEPVRKMAANPNVTVRSRGVMEKCTYCVQRIERKRIDARIEGRPIRDGELQTACQQVCPAQAITFGSLNDPGSQVAKLHEDQRRYNLLHEIGTRPRTVYLARVRNPNPELG